MSDRIDPPSDDFERGPWPPVSDVSQLFDHGWRWCVHAAGHPDPDGGYPHPEGHVPWHECRSRAAFLDDVRRDLDGESVGVHRGPDPVRRAADKDEASRAAVATASTDGRALNVVRGIRCRDNGSSCTCGSHRRNLPARTCCRVALHRPSRSSLNTPRAPPARTPTTRRHASGSASAFPEAGCVWTFLGEARDPSFIRPAAIVVAGGNDEPVFARVVDIADAGAERKVHHDVLPAAPERYLEAAELASRRPLTLSRNSSLNTHCLRPRGASLRATSEVLADERGGHHRVLSRHLLDFRPWRSGRRAASVIFRTEFAPSICRTSLGARDGCAG